jgi:hypothetical protein
MPPPKILKERDVMKCRACGLDERASEGYPCTDCGTFICLPCTLRGVIRCRACQELADKVAAETPEPPSPRLTWPEH